MIGVFKRLPSFLFILTVSISLISASPVFADDSNAKLVEKFWVSEEFSQIFKSMVAEELFKRQAEIYVYIPKRHGFKDDAGGTATVIEKVVKEKDQKIIYRFLLCCHEIHEMDYVLKHWKEAGIKVFVLGKNRRRIKAEILAWNWFTESLVIEAEIPFKLKGNFDFEVVEMPKEIASALISEERSFGKYERIFSGGFAKGHFAWNSAYVSEYVNNDRPMLFDGAMAIIPRRMAVMYDYFGGQGQSGGGYLRAVVKIGKDGKPEIERMELLGIVIGALPYREGLDIGVPIDVIVELFLKQIPELSSLNLPTFKINNSLYDYAITNFPEKENKPNN